MVRGFERGPRQIRPGGASGSCWSVCAVGWLLAGPALADVNAGAQRSASCAHCHGTDGNSSSGAYPNLAGQQKEYLYRQIKAFKDGTRKDAADVADGGHFD